MQKLALYSNIARVGQIVIIAHNARHRNNGTAVDGVHIKRIFGSKGKVHDIFAWEVIFGNLLAFGIEHDDFGGAGGIFV